MSTPEVEKPSIISRLTSNADVQQTVQQYDLIAREYDETFPVARVTGPRLVLETLDSLFPADGPTARGQLKVMDIASGTGLVGQQLYNAGFTNLDALEPSAEMIKVSQRHGIYNQRMIHDVIGQHRIDVQDNTYDAVVVAGAFIPGHCPITALDEMIRICKTGGYIVNSMRIEFIFIAKEYNDQLLPHMQSLEDRGLWRRVSQTVTDGIYETTKQGITWVYQKL